MHSLTFGAVNAKLNSSRQHQNSTEMRIAWIKIICHGKMNTASLSWHAGLY